MPAYTGTSSKFGDASSIAQDLLKDIPAEIPAGSLAFLTCDSQVDSQALLGLLNQRLQCGIMGGTTFTYPLAEQTNETSSALTVLSMEHLEYSVVVSGELDVADAAGQMAGLYQSCLAGLDGEPRMIMLFMPMIPGMPADPFITAVIQNAGGIPVFGGVTTDDLDSTKAAIFANGKAYHDRMAMIAFGGSIRPVFSVGSQLTVMADYAPAVTEAEGQIVKKVDDMTFCDYMRSIGIAPEQRKNGVDALVQFGPLPCRLRHKLKDDDGVPEIRCISYCDLEQGSVVFSSNLPVGTRVNMGLIQKNDVVESSHRCIQELNRLMEENEKDGYRYEAVFAVPCVARYFAMLGGENLESALLLKEAPVGLAMSAYYGFCEVGPTYGSNGEIHNRSHNASIVMCAF